VATVSAGSDNVDVLAPAGAGVVVCNTPGVLDQTTADLAARGVVTVLAGGTLANAVGLLAG
jgi:lactate dehydrogenase-like 2-hydroxyacid dehydrogenase